jgi:hypothetical protein
MSMRTTALVSSMGVGLAVPPAALADVVTDWNSTLRAVMQNDGLLNSPALDIASFVHGNHFQAVPEPASFVLGSLAFGSLIAAKRRGRLY